jgi:hypothetical protein
MWAGERYAVQMLQRHPLEDFILGDVLEQRGRRLHGVDRLRDLEARDGAAFHGEQHQRGGVFRFVIASPAWAGVAIQPFKQLTAPSNAAGLDCFVALAGPSQ